MERQASPAVTDSAPAQPEVERRSGAVADSLKKDRLPRDIHGVLSDYPYGGPIVGAAVTAAAEDNPNKPWTRVISDSSGGYTITHSATRPGLHHGAVPEGHQSPGWADGSQQCLR